MQFINRLEFLKAIGAGILAMPRLAAAETKTARPNIVYILADDMGYGDLACQNPKTKIPTPNLDRLASQGARFTDAHTPSGVCTPTRYGVLTGRYCWRSALKRGVLNGYSPRLIEPGRMTVASLLRQNGYSTACLGKWHLGMDWQSKGEGSAGKKNGWQVDYTKPIQNGPNTVGFDYYFGISASLDMPPFVFIENDRCQGVPTVEKTFVRKGPAAEDFEAVSVLPTLTRKAVAWINQQAAQAKEGKPFFLYFPLNAPHAPIVPAPEFKSKSQAGDYGDFVNQVDWTVGEVLAALDGARLADNTLVIFTSDNGPERFAYERVQEYRHYSMGDLRGVKRDTWEGGHRVPFLARWPGKIQAGSISNEIISHVDLMATAASLIGASLPANAGEDSYNILPALLGQKLEKPIREATVYHSSKGDFAIRQGNWVFIDSRSGEDSKEPDWFKQERGYKPHNFPGELFDLSQDISERGNLYGEHPERVRELKALLQKYKDDGRSASLLKR